MTYKMTLTPMREDRPRYAVTVSYERRSEATPARVAAAAAAVDFVIAVRREYEWVQDPNGKWRWMCVRVTELRRPPGLKGREWPRKIDRPYEEPEWVRRARVRAMRKAIHVDPALGAQEPDWDAALQLRLDAEARARAGETAGASA